LEGMSNPKGIPMRSVAGLVFGGRKACRMGKVLMDTYNLQSVCLERS